jgi:hypothetical protein
LDHGVVGAPDLGIVRVVLHALEGVGDAPCPVLVERGIGLDLVRAGAADAAHVAVGAVGEFLDRRGLDGAVAGDPDGVGLAGQMTGEGRQSPFETPDKSAPGIGLESAARALEGIRVILGLGGGGTALVGLRLEALVMLGERVGVDAAVGQGLAGLDRIALAAPVLDAIRHAEFADVHDGPSPRAFVLKVRADR